MIQSPVSAATTNDRSAESSNSIRTEAHPHCLLCGTRGGPLYEHLRDRLFGAPGEWSLVRCENAGCGLIWLNPMPLEEDIWVAYEQYYTHEKAAPPNSFLRDLLYAVLGLAQERQRMAAFYLDRSSPGRLLEVGFGDGRLLQQFNARGWCVEGQEIDPVAVRNARARGIRVHEGRLQDLEIATGEFDVVLGSHVIEHVHDPLGFLRKCRDLLKPGGRLLMLTPNADSYGHRRFGRHWRGLEPPRHLNLFTPQALSTLGHRAGFSRYDIWTSHSRASANFLDSIELGRGFKDRPTESPKFTTQIQVAVHLTAARLLFFMDPMTGEEMLLTAAR